MSSREMALAAGFLALVVVLAVFVPAASARIEPNPSLIKNGGFEQCLQYWYVGAGSPTCKTTPQPHSGSRLLSIGNEPDLVPGFGHFKEMVFQVFAYSAAEIDAYAWIRVPDYEPTFGGADSTVFYVNIYDVESESNLLIWVEPFTSGSQVRVTGRVYVGGQLVYESSPAYIPTDTWVSVEIVKVGTEARFYAGGTLLGTYSNVPLYEFDMIILSYNGVPHISGYPVYVDDVAVYDIG